MNSELSRGRTSATTRLATTMVQSLEVQAQEGRKATATKGVCFGMTPMACAFILVLVFAGSSVGLFIFATSDGLTPAQAQHGEGSGALAPSPSFVPPSPSPVFSPAPAPSSNGGSGGSGGGDSGGGGSGGGGSGGGASPGAAPSPSSPAPPAQNLEPFVVDSFSVVAPKVRYTC